MKYKPQVTVQNWHSSITPGRHCQTEAFTYRSMQISQHGISLLQQHLTVAWQSSLLNAKNLHHLGEIDATKILTSPKEDDMGFQMQVRWKTGLSACCNVAIAKNIFLSAIRRWHVPQVQFSNKNMEKETNSQFFKHLHHVSKGSLKIKGRNEMHHLNSKLGTGFKAQKAWSCPTGS